MSGYGYPTVVEPMQIEMGFDIRRPGKGLVIALLFALPLVLGLSWCFYDAYWPRPLPLEALYQVGGKGEVIGSDDERALLHLPHPLPQTAFFIELENKSRFYLNSAKVVFVVKAGDGRILSIEEAPCYQLGRAEFSVPPARAERPAAGFCLLPLSKASQRALDSRDFARRDWYFSELHGHHAPIRLIARPLDLVAFMFERVYE